MGFTLPSFWRAATPPTTAQLNEQRALDATATLELEGAQAPQSRTISNGSISPTAAYVIVDTEGSAAADDLSVISPVLSVSENLHDGMILYLKAADSGRVVTVKNTSSANGINTYDGNDYVLSTNHWFKLQLRSGKWYEAEGRAMETALAAAGAAAAASIPATTTARGIGRVAASADLVDGATINNGPAFLAAGVHTSVAAAAGKVPVADSNGHLPQGWCGSMLCNVRTVITVSGTFTVPISGWYRVTAIGGGGGGGKGSYAEPTATNGGSGGSQGGTTSFGALVSAVGGSGGAGAASGTSQGTGGGGGGGGAGIVFIRYLYLTKDTSISVVIGAGGAGGTAITGVTYMGGSGAGPSAGIGGNYVSGQGAVGAGNGLNGPGEPGSGGNGGINGLGYGGGGGGGAGQEGSRNNLLTPGGVASEGGTGGQGTTATSPSATTAGNGGAGGPGAIILEYFDPSVTS